MPNQRGAMRAALAGALAFTAVVCAVPHAPAAAQTDAVAHRQIALIAVLSDMRKRDRFGVPAEELAAWEDWAAQIGAEPDAPASVVAETRLGLAIARFYAKQYETGLTEAQAARAIVPALGHAPTFAAELDAYTSLLLTELGQFDEADQLARNAMDAAKKSQRPGDLALAHNARANLAFARNDLPTALTSFCKARELGLGDAWADPGMVVNNAASCAALHYYLETPETLEQVRIVRDYALANLPPDHGRMGNVYNTGYAILLLYGRHAEAEDLIRQHLALERRLHSGDADDIYDPLSMLARVRSRRGALEDAADLFAAAAAMAERLSNGAQPYIAGISRANEARVLAQLGQLDRAKAQAQRGLDRLRADVAPDDWHIGSVQVLLADIARQQGELEHGLALLDEGLILLRAKLPPTHSEVVTGQMVRAQLLARMGERAAALGVARDLVTVLEDKMFDLTAGERGQVALEPFLQSAFGRYLDVALHTGSDRDAVRASQLQLISNLTVTNARIAGARAAQDAGIATLLAELETAQIAMEEAEAALRGAQGDDALDSAPLAASLQTARLRTAAAEQALIAQFPDWTALTRPHVASLEVLQAKLEPGAMLVLPVALEDRAITIGITADTMALGQSAVRRDELAALSDDLRRGITVPSALDEAAAQQMFAHVFPPEVAALLDQTEHLVFPASGYLARIPPAMLQRPNAREGSNDRGHDGGKGAWLVRSHSIAIAANFAGNSAANISADDSSAFAAQDQQTAFLGIGAPLAIAAAIAQADETYRLNLAPLPEAEAELIAISEALQSAQIDVLTGANATEQRYREKAAAVRGGVLAFATHGLIGGEVPGLSEPALLLTPDPQNAQSTQNAQSSGDGFLTASEIARVPLNADWVILSACNTASGADGSAPAYSGLANAFTKAGARNLMLSHWPVRDDASAFLSVETVRGAAGGMARARALQQAQIALMDSATIRDAAHPAIWAPFVMVEN